MFLDQQLPRLAQIMSWPENADLVQLSCEMRNVCQNYGPAALRSVKCLENYPGTVRAKCET